VKKWDPLEINHGMAIAFPNRFRLVSRTYGFVVLVKTGHSEYENYEINKINLEMGETSNDLLLGDQHSSNLRSSHLPKDMPIYSLQHVEFSPKPQKTMGETDSFRVFF